MGRSHSAGASRVRATGAAPHRRRSLALAAAAACLGAARAVSMQYQVGIAPNRQNARGASQSVPLSDELWAAVPLKSALPSEFPNLPAGCTCVNEVQTSSDCTSFVCEQTCNLQLGQCDPFCCSDPDCSADEVERFRAQGACLDDGSRNTVMQCTDVSSLDKVNAKYNMYIEQDDDPLASFLCVAVNNNPIEGEFFEPQTGLINNVALLDSGNYRPDQSFQGEATTTGDLFEFYNVGDPLLAATSVNGALRSLYGGRMRLPTAGPDGECGSSTNFVAFGKPVQRNTCVRSVASIQQACESEWGALNVRGLLQTLRIGTTPQSALNSPTNVNWVQAELGIVSFRDPVTGELTATHTPAPVSNSAAPSPAPTTTEAPTPSPVASASPTSNPTNSTSVSAAPSVSPSAAPSLSPVAGRRLQSGKNANAFASWDAASGVCRNALVGLRLNVAHDAAGLVQTATLDVTVADLASQDGSGSSGVAVEQRFEVAFLNTDSNTTANSPRVDRIVSGNPGYIQGRRVQAGVLAELDAGTNEEKIAVEYHREGLAMMAAPGSKGQCIPTSKASERWVDALRTQPASRTPVQFNVDASSSCTVELEYEDFEDMTSWCSDFSRFPIFQLEADVVGIYGNADPLHAYEWVPIEVDYTKLLKTKANPFPGALVCENVVDRLDIEIMWTNSGDVRNPQPMILAIRAVPAQSNWQWRKAPVPGTKQTFTLSHTVTYIEHTLDAEDSSTYKPEVSTILPQLAYDVFYPFDILVSPGAVVRAPSFGPAALCLALLLHQLAAAF